MINRGRFRPARLPATTSLSERKEEVMYRLLVAMCVLTTGLFFAACEEQGPAERAGERMDETAERMGESMEEMGESVEESGEGR